MTGALYNALFVDNCEVADMMVTHGHPLRSPVGHRSVISYTESCPSTFRLILHQITFINVTDLGAMNVEIGDEVLLIDIPELEDKVIVINWKTLSYFSWNGL